MKLIDASVSMITETDPYKKVELAGRTCYKSEDKITAESSEKFVNALIKRQHVAMLEHAEVTFGIHLDDGVDFDYNLLHIPFLRHSDYTLNGETMHFVTVSLSHLYNPIWSNHPYIEDFKIAFESYRIKNSNRIRFIGYELIVITDVRLAMFSMPIGYRDTFWNVHGSYTFKFVCDRGVSHELVRHRCSFAQESTRYCNYAKESFGKEITFIKPSTFDTWSEGSQSEFREACILAEEAYLQLSKDGLTPQQARAVLPNALKTEVIMTAPVYQWKHFFNLRSIGTTGAPHPDMKQVADIAYQMFKEAENSEPLMSDMI